MPGLFDKLIVGEADRYGKKIDFIIARSTEVIVYTVEGGDLMIDTASEVPTKREQEILKSYGRLYSFVLIALQKDKAVPLKRDLGAALFLAISDKDGTCAPDDYFTDVSEHIHSRALDIARFVYVVFGLLFALVVSLAFYLGYVFPLQDFAQAPSTILGAIGGMIGSALSVFVRSSDLQISPYKQRVFSAFQGMSRIALGALFGFIFVCCVKANILLGVLSDQPFGILAFSILAGFSETFVPELLKRMETEAH
jgi:hypothetical protein